MRARLDTAVLLGEAPGRGREPEGRVLFLVHRAADGWIALELTGDLLSLCIPQLGDLHDRVRPSCRGVRLLRGGPAFPERVFSLYAFDFDPESCGGLRVPGPGPLRLGFGGNLAALLRAAAEEESPRLLLFRGLTALAQRSRSAPEEATVARASIDLVFETPPRALWQAVRRASRREQEVQDGGFPVFANPLARRRLERRTTAP